MAHQALWRSSNSWDSYDCDRFEAEHRIRCIETQLHTDRISDDESLLVTIRNIQTNESFQMAKSLAVQHSLCMAQMLSSYKECTIDAGEGVLGIFQQFVVTGKWAEQEDEVLADKDGLLAPGNDTDHGANTDTTIKHKEKAAWEALRLAIQLDALALGRYAMKSIMRLYPVGTGNKLPPPRIVASTWNQNLTSLELAPTRTFEGSMVPHLEFIVRFLVRQWKTDRVIPAEEWYEEAFDETPGPQGCHIHTHAGEVWYSHLGSGRQIRHL